MPVVVVPLVAGETVCLIRRVKEGREIHRVVASGAGRIRMNPQELEPAGDPGMVEFPVPPEGGGVAVGTSGGGSAPFVGVQVPRFMADHAIVRVRRIEDRFKAPVGVAEGAGQANVDPEEGKAP